MGNPSQGCTVPTAFQKVLNNFKEKFLKSQLHKFGRDTGPSKVLRTNLNLRVAQDSFYLTLEELVHPSGQVNRDLSRQDHGSQLQAAEPSAKLPEVRHLHYEMH